MPSATVGVDIATPCGQVTVKKVINIPFELPDLSFFLNFPPKFPIPWPNCNFVKHLNSAPEPDSDSQP
jgi:hypothetical protein